MSIAQDIRDAVQAARARSAATPDNGFLQVLKEVAEGLSDESVETTWVDGPGGRYTLRLAPAHQPSRASAILSVVISSASAEVLIDPKQVAQTPGELADILKKLVTLGPFLETLDVVAAQAKEPVEGFLRVRPRNISREDLMLEVPPDAQRKLAENVGGNVSLLLKVSSFPGAGVFTPGAGYTILESAGLVLELSKEAQQGPEGQIQIEGRVSEMPSSGRTWQEHLLDDDPY